MLNDIDFSPLVTSFGYLLVALVIIGVFKSPWFKGILGEYIVNLIAKLSLDKNVYHLIKDVTLPTDDGGTTQIDHIIVSPYGVFVVETKNMKGWIFGGQQQKKWTQSLKGGNKHQFQNPLHQNYKHVKTLQSHLELEDNQIHSVVVFVGESTFKTEMPPNVTHGLGYVRHIKSKVEHVLSEWEIRRVTGLIDSGRLERSLKTSRDHVEHLHSIKQVKPVETSPRCPKCGSSMVLRTAKRGINAGNQFWGCERYPQCRGVVNL